MQSLVDLPARCAQRTTAWWHGRATRSGDVSGPGAERVARVLAPCPWAILAIGMAANVVAQAFGAQVSEPALLGLMGVFFTLLLVQLGLAAWIRRGRRPALLLLLGALAAWSLGVMIVNAAKVEAEQQFPAPGEWLFLASYVGMAGYLLLDVDRRQQLAIRGWLDIAVICGAIACLASLLLVAPIQLASGQRGISLFLSLVYPLADAVLALLVVGQWLQHARRDPLKSALLVLAFVLLTIADSSFALLVEAHSYEFSAISYALWGASFAVLVAAASRAERSVLQVIPKAAGTGVLVSAGAVALAVLAIRPGDTLSYYVLPPAVITAISVGIRMVLALRDANKATEAFALSQTDDLTKLPNRRAVRRRLRESFDEGRPLALMLLDLDSFKEINDSLGHRAGDTVLNLVAVRVAEAVDPHAMVARLGGDEFAIILDSTDEIELMEIAQHIRRELAQPLMIDGIEICPSGSIGVAIASDPDAREGEMLRRADVAMYQAKSSGSGAALYDAELDDFSRSRLQLVEELRKGFAEGQVEVWYQPQLEVPSMKLVGFEALVRWRHPEQGLISPVSFLPAARRAGLMGTLSVAVVRQALDDLHVLDSVGVDTRVAINCAPLELLSPTFLDHLFDVLERRPLMAERLVLEITEDSFLVDAQHARAVLVQLRDRGIEVSVDDYGTGFSSLTYLRNLPIQELKIDRSLIANVANDKRSRMIVASTIQLARALDMRSVAEGVENAADLDVLVSMGIDRVQGYHLARPMPSTDLVEWARRYRAQQSGAPEQTDQNRRTT